MTEEHMVETTTAGGFFRNGIKSFLIDCGRILGSTTAEMYCIRSSLIGVILWIGILFNPRFALFYIVGILISDVVASLLATRDDQYQEKTFRINGALTAMACAWLLEPSWLPYPYQAGITILVVMISSVLTATLLAILKTSNLPPLTWGYSLTSGFMFQLFPIWAHFAQSSLLNWSYPASVFGWCNSFLRSLGVLLYQPRPEVGVAVALAIILWSRAMFINGLVAWISGVLIGLVLSIFDVRYLWLLSAHNYFIAGMLLSSVYFLPGRFSLVLAIIAGIISSLLAAITQNIQPESAWAFLPIPSALTIWIGIKALSFSEINGYIRYNTMPFIPPENAWWTAERWRRIFGNNEPLLTIPVSQSVCIAQSFSGNLSHRGNWQHAIDFVHIPINLQGESNLSLWDTAVYSPGYGTIERCRDDIPDNPLGVSNFANNWGNYVIIRLDIGGWVLLAHLKRGSVTVKSGASVNTGDYIGKVGNSGRSPFPHLHMQAQTMPHPGSPTRPFRLANYLNGGEERGPLIRWVGAGVPEQGNELIAAAPNPIIFSMITRFAPGIAVWEYQCSGRVPVPYNKFKTGSLLTITIEIDDLGRHILKSSAGGTIITNMDPDAWRIYEVHDLSCPILSLIAIIGTSVPYALSMNMHWQEPIIYNGYNRFEWLKTLLAPYVNQPFINATSICTKMPDPDGRGLEIKTSIDLPKNELPSITECIFSTIRGPENIKGHFSTGEVSANLISFEPRYPSQGIKQLSIVSENINIKDLNQVRKNQVQSESSPVNIKT